MIENRQKREEKKEREESQFYGNGESYGRLIFSCLRRYDYYTGDYLSTNNTGKGVVLMTGLSHINMFVVNGTVFVTQVSAGSELSSWKRSIHGALSIEQQEPGSSAEETRKNPYTVTAAFPITSTAHGWLYVDDGITSDQSAHDLIRFNITGDTFTMERVHNRFKGSEGISTVVDQLRLFGLELNEEQVPSGADYNHYTRVLTFNHLNYDWTLNDKYVLNFIVW